MSAVPGEQAAAAPPAPSSPAPSSSAAPPPAPSSPAPSPPASSSAPDERGSGGPEPSPSVRDVDDRPRWPRAVARCATVEPSDVVVLFLLFAVALIVALMLPPAAGPWWLAAGFGVLGTLPVLVRRRRPVTALVVHLTTLPVSTALFLVSPGWTWAVLMFGLARRVPPRRSIPVGVGASVGVLLAVGGVAAARTGASFPGVTTGLVASLVPLVGIGAGLGATARRRAVRVAARREQAEREQLAAALADERDRIAGELGGLVVGRLERIAELADRLPAPPAEPAVDARPAAGRAEDVPGPGDDLALALGAIGTETRGALTAMRSALGLLRAEPEQVPAPPPALPPPALPPPALPASSGGWRRVPTASGLLLAGTAGALIVVSAVLMALAGAAPSGPAGVLDADPGNVAGLVGLGVQVAALGWWRRAPLAALVLATAGSVTSGAAGATHVVAEGSWMVLVYAAGVGAPAVASGLVVAACTAAILGLFLSDTAVGALIPWSPATLVLSYVLVPALWGLGVFQRRAARAADRRQKARAAAAADRALRRQRLGLARELHDVLAQELSALTVLVNAARCSDDPAASVEDVRARGRRVAGSVPALLAVAGPEPAACALDSRVLDAVAEPVRSAGLPVEVDVSGEPGTGDPEVDLFATRIVTEALTNVLRHAGPVPTTVSVRHGVADVVVVVRDQGPRDGHRPDVSGSGRGLVGMRERAELVGGDLEVGPYGPGWQVRARLPRAASSP